MCYCLGFNEARIETGSQGVETSSSQPIQGG